MPLWNRNTANIETAQARQLQAETSLLVARLGSGNQGFGSDNDLQRKGARIEQVAARRHEAVFQEAAELADRHYRLGRCR